MGAVAAVASAALPIINVVGAITSVASTLMGMSQLKKEMKFQVPTYRIPVEDIQMLKNQIQANAQLTDQARQIAIQALEGYRSGQLSPVYQDLLNKYSEERINMLKAELAKRGIPEGSTIYNQAMARAVQDINAYKAGLLRQQLDDALRAAGLSDSVINQLYNKWQIESGIVSRGAQMEFARRVYQQGLRDRQMGLAGELARGLPQMAESIGRVFDKGEGKGLSYYLGGERKEEKEVE